MRIIAGVVSAGTCAALVLVSGCGTGSDGEEGPVTTTVTEGTATVTEAEPPGTTAPPAGEQAPEEGPAPGRWAMPNLIGTTLQDAQDQIQALTTGAVFFTGSRDLSGQDRSQVLDRNWKVCTQNIEPGATLTADSQVDLGVVKLEEACP